MSTYEWTRKKAKSKTMITKYDQDGKLVKEIAELKNPVEGPSVIDLVTDG